MAVTQATPVDLEEILGWLEVEYHKNGEGFWSNRTLISAALPKGELWVVRRDGQAVAVQVGTYAPVIVSVRENFREQGIGSELFAATLGRARRDGIDAMFGECAPETSFPFWQKHGFERYVDRNRPAAIMVRRLIERAFALPADAPRVEVSVSFLPEAALYKSGVSPIVEHRVTGGRLVDGRVQLPKRLVGFTDDEPEGHDLAVRVMVDGSQRCLTKAKYSDAKAVGVESGEGLFYVDGIKGTG